MEELTEDHTEDLVEELTEELPEDLPENLTEEKRQNNDPETLRQERLQCFRIVLFPRATTEVEHRSAAMVKYPNVCIGVFGFIRNVSIFSKNHHAENNFRRTPHIRYRNKMNQMQ